MAENVAEPGTDSLLPTRRSLLSRLRDWQDDAGWREFFDTYWRLIYNVARKSGLADAEAQDVVQKHFHLPRSTDAGFPLRPGTWFIQVMAARCDALAHPYILAHAKGGRK